MQPVYLAWDGTSTHEVPKISPTADMAGSSSFDMLSIIAILKVRKDQQTPQAFFLAMDWNSAMVATSGVAI